MKIESIKLWENRDDVILTTFLSPTSELLGMDMRRPAVIVCPGGAWQLCSRDSDEGDAVAMSFAVDGYQAFVLEYSVSDKSAKEDVLFPAQILDLGKAMLTIRERAEEWQVDPNKISLVGFSAGGSLCAMMATIWHESLLSETFNRPAEEFKPLSAICIYGVYDFVYHNEHTFSPSQAEDVNIRVFGTATPTREQEEDNSPYYKVSEKTVPVFMAAATDDTVVPSLQTVRMAERLHVIGVPYELHMFQYGDHGFALGRNIFEPFRDDKARANETWVALAKTFLLHQIAKESLENEFKLSDVIDLSVFG